MRSVAANSGCWLTNSSMAGTANVVVTPYGGTSSRKRPGSKLRCSTISPPFCQVMSVVTLRPPMWKSGRDHQGHVVLAHVEKCSALVLFHQRLAWVSMAPLGRPVVPDVYMMTATSSASTGSASVSGGTVARHRGKRRPAVVGGIGADVAAAGELIADPVDHRAVVLVDHDRVDAGVVDDVAELGAGEAEVEGDEDGAEPGRGEHRLEEGRLVEAEERDPVAVVDAVGAEPSGQPVDALLHLPVRPGRALEGEGPTVGGAPGSLGEPVAEADVGCRHERFPRLFVSRDASDADDIREPKPGPRRRFSQTARSQHEGRRTTWPRPHRCPG